MIFHKTMVKTEKQKDYDKKWNEENIEKCRAYRAKWRRNNLDKHKEINKRYVLNNKNVIKARELARFLPMKDSCEICGSKNKLEKHHWRYDKPLLVNTLCQPCHEIQHNRKVI